MIYTRYLVQVGLIDEKTVLRVDRSLVPLAVPKHLKELTEEEAFTACPSLRHKINEMMPTEGNQVTLSVYAENL